MEQFEMEISSFKHGSVQCQWIVQSSTFEWFQSQVTRTRDVSAAILYLTEKLKLDNYRPNVADIVKSVKTFQWNELALRLSLKWSEQIRRPTLPFSDPLNWMKWRNAHPPQENRWLALTTGGPAGPKLFRLWEIVKGKPSEICTYSLLAASYCFKRQFPKKKSRSRKS